MDFPKLSSPSLKDLFVREIENMILSGKLSVGDKLPPERELAEMMSVSRTVVNSGLSELSRIGFIEIQPRIGAVVSDFNRKGTIETLNAILRYKGGVLTDAEMKSLLEIRLAIENLAIELAIPHLDDTNLNMIGTLIEEFAGTENPLSSAECIFSLHHEICVISGNSILPIVFYSFKELAVGMWERYFRMHGKSFLLKNTRELYTYMESGDTENALKTFHESLKNTINGLRSIYHRG
jgi:DNA-binding FadR family transcriptional regulator